jgi:hypothetical protein
VSEGGAEKSHHITAGWCGVGTSQGVHGGNALEEAYGDLRLLVEELWRQALRQALAAGLDHIALLLLQQPPQRLAE